MRCMLNITQKLCRLPCMPRFASSANEVGIAAKNCFPFHRTGGLTVLCRRFLCESGNFPTHRVLNLPALSPTMDTGSIVSWSVKEGDKVEEGDVLADIETDKAVVSFEVVDGGYVAKILVEQGTKQIPLGTPVCILVDNAEDVDKFKDWSASPEESTKSSQTEIEGSKPFSNDTTSAVRSDDSFSSGQSAIKQEAKQPQPEQLDHRLPNSKGPMVVSKALIPHYYLSVGVSFHSINEIAKSNKNINPFSVIVKAAAVALQQVPDVNSRWMDTLIRRYNTSCIKIMSNDQSDRYVSNADSLSLSEISKQLEQPVKLPKQSTFTIWRLPSGTSCAAIIDPTQAAILCVSDECSNVTKPATSKVTISCDHRVIDGAVGAQWLKNFKQLSECPVLLSQ